MAEPVVEIVDVVKRFAPGGRSVTALDRLTAQVTAGQVTGLVGPDGAGKTTLMRLVAGLLVPDAGRIAVLGMDSVRDAHKIQANVGYMPQRFGLYEDLSVAENLSLYADLQGVTGDARKQRIERLMEFTALGPFRGRLAGRLSGGMKQKLGLACTLVHPPRLLLLDEPSVGVDPVSRRELWEIVYTLVGEGMSVLLSTAYLDEAEHCHEVLLLSGGRLLDHGPPKRFSERLKGRTYALPVEGRGKRAILRRAQARSGVLDALIKGRDIRLLLARDADPACLAGLAENGDGPGPEARPVAPGFEDAFIALLKERPQENPQGEAPSAPIMEAPAREAAGEAPTGEAAGEPAAPRREMDAMAVPAAPRPPEPTAPRRQEPVIDVEGLTRLFGDFRAVDAITFHVRPGEIFGLLGPNGAGKSTTFKMLCGLLPPSAGKALVLGIDLVHAAAMARGRIGYMAQKFSLYGDLTVVQNLRFFASAYGLTGRSKRDRVDWALTEFGLGPYADGDSGDLPLGYKQRLALACAILHEPGILFLDEPTSGVDPLVRRAFWTRINAMAEAGVTVMVTTHFMDEAEYCDRIGIIYRGKLIAIGSPDALKAEHATPDKPEPTLEDTFIDLIETYDGGRPL